MPSELEVTPMRHMMDKADPIADVRFEADIEGKLTAIVAIPAKQPPGVYAGMVVPSYTDVPLGVLTIEVLA